MIEIEGTKFKVDDTAVVLRHNGVKVLVESVKIKSVSVEIKREDPTMGGKLSYSVSYTVGYGHKLGVLNDKNLFRNKEEALASI